MIISSNFFNLLQSCARSLRSSNCRRMSCTCNIFAAFHFAAWFPSHFPSEFASPHLRKISQNFHFTLKFIWFLHTMRQSWCRVHDRCCLFSKNQIFSFCFEYTPANVIEQLSFASASIVTFDDRWRFHSKLQWKLLMNLVESLLSSDSRIRNDFFFFLFYLLFINCRVLNTNMIKRKLSNHIKVKKNAS